jgi:hypothetical protein
MQPIQGKLGINIGQYISVIGICPALVLQDSSPKMVCIAYTQMQSNDTENRAATDFRHQERLGFRSYELLYSSYDLL